MRRIALLTVLLAALVVPVAGARTTDTTLSLVAYSTPKAAFSTIIPAFQTDARGQGRQLHAVVRAVRPTRPTRSSTGLPADVVDFSLEPDMRTLVKAGLVAPNWNANKYKGIVTHSVVVIVFRDGQPEAHPRAGTTSIKPGVRGADAEPVHLRRRALERPRRVRRAAQARARRRSRPAQYLTSSSTTSSCRTSRRATRSTRSSPARATRCSRTRTRRCSRSAAGSRSTSTSRRRRSGSTTRSPPRRTSKNKGTAKAFVKFLYTPAAQKLFAQSGYRPVLHERDQGLQLPGAPAALHDRLPRRLDEGRKEVLRPEQRV